MGGKQGFRAQYFTARNALEAGNYDVARRSYSRLIADAGPLAERLELEYAHSELRAGNFPEAARIAASLAARQSGAARGAALAVQGTAQHELGLAQLAEGKTEAGKASLVAAQAALGTVIEGHPELDPLGSMAGRHASIAARLARL
ncbi:hypothetical protein [Salipiger abyssi]|uniref:Tetratricopeptide repeat protein n=1 Tax=Salipiger abyssi TaxID=1250539 RepID=A0A1P8UXD3_9RHOB|nr:hypothetical protein [Salipiger abyssi]APZ54037.1 hypothetical protein Ga0080574_TMP3703 [Salipiger abyssi]